MITMLTYVGKIPYATMRFISMFEIEIRPVENSVSQNEPDTCTKDKAPRISFSMTILPMNLLLSSLSSYTVGIIPVS